MYVRNISTDVGCSDAQWDWQSETIQGDMMAEQSNIHTPYMGVRV